MHPRGEGLLWCRCAKKHHWQFPQGGVDQGESPDRAAWRELYEETGLTPDNTRLVEKTQQWLRYQLPAALVKSRARNNEERQFVGQMQRWYLFQLTGSEDTIDLAATDQPEFDRWRWIEYWNPLETIVDFKKDVYREVLSHFHPYYEDIGTEEARTGLQQKSSPT